MTVHVELTEPEARAVIHAINIFRDDYDFNDRTMWMAWRKITTAIETETGSTQP